MHPVIYQKRYTVHVFLFFPVSLFRSVFFFSATALFSPHVSGVSFMGRKNEKKIFQVFLFVFFFSLSFR